MMAYFTANTANDTLDVISLIWMLFMLSDASTGIKQVLGRQHNLPCLSGHIYKSQIIIW